MGNKKLTWKLRLELWLRLTLRLGLTGAAVWLTVRFGPGLLSLLAPFVPALAAAALLDGPVRWLQRRLGWGRQGAAALLLLTLLGLLAAGLVPALRLAGRELAELAQNRELLLSGARTALERLEGLLARLPPGALEAARAAEEALVDRLRESVPALLSRLAAGAGQAAMALPALLADLAVFLLAAWFFTADFPYLRTRAARALDEELRRTLADVSAALRAGLWGYLKAELLLSAGVFAILLAGFLLTRQPYALLLALALALLDFIPIVGAGTALLPWAAAALLAGDTPAALRLAVIWGCIALFRRLAEPKLVGDHTGLSPLLSLAGLYVGLRLWGVAGLILAPLLLLVLVHLSGLGLLRPLRRDLEAAGRDLAAILSG